MFSSRPHLLQTPSSLLNPGALCRYGSTWEKQGMKQPISKTTNLLYNTRLFISVSSCRFFNLIEIIIPVQQFELTLNKVVPLALKHFIHQKSNRWSRSFICSLDSSLVFSHTTLTNKLFRALRPLRHSTILQCWEDLQKKKFLSATDKLCFSATMFLSLPEATSPNVSLT